MIKAIITDIEGTTSSLSFVKEVLYPYARKRMADFVWDHAYEPKFSSLLAAVSDEVGTQLTTEEIISYLLEWMEQDKKVTPLKAIQGLIWEAGYQQGDFKGHLYPDAVEALKKWREQGLALYVYSSGSVHAQKLLFGNTDLGDLTPLFTGYFDTHIGAKRLASSYRTIAEHIGLPASELLFLSDIKEELDAAHNAGFGTIWLVREGALDPHAGHKQVASFDEIRV